MMKGEIKTRMQYNIAEDFWLQKLKGVTFNPLFGEKKNLEAPPVKTLKQWRQPFPPGLSEIVNTAIGGSDTEAFLVFLTALNILVYKYTSTNDILLAVTDFLEDAPGEPSDGLIFFRSLLNGDSIPRDLLDTALDDLNDAYDHRQFEFESFFNRFCTKNIGDRQALSALGFSYDNFNRNCRRADRLDILFRIENHHQGFVLITSYDTQCYRQYQVEQLGRHFMNTLSSMLHDLEQPIHSIDIFSAEDRRKLLVEFSGKKVQYPLKEKTFIPSFESQVKKNLLSTALICEKEVMNYRQLNEMANQLARCFLKETPIQRENPVAILLERSEKMLASIIATWKCGAAYVPIDTDFPDDRIKTILRDSGAKLLITESGVLAPGLEKDLHSIIAIIYLDKLEKVPNKGDNTNIDITVPVDSLAYVIYTSGSTGTPKGVMVEHLGMMNHLYAKLADLQVSHQSVIAQNASQCFDISIWQFFAALLKGGRTIVYTNQLVLNPEELIKRIGKDDVTILEVVPSYLVMMLEIIEERHLTNVFPALKYLLVTGETLRPALVKRWFEKFPDIKMVNAYGPTEASDDITHFIMDRFPANEAGNIPIGSTVRNFRIYIVAPNMNLCPVGVKGEICVSGIGVGRGYLNDARKTCTAFTKDPFPGKPGIRMYRTGDIGRYLPDGNIEFFGRKDYQVKIRGYRIELEEIGNKLSALRGIKDVVVIDREDKANNKYLCAYVTLLAGIEKEAGVIKRELRYVLPEYMIPANIVLLDVLPLTPSGKVDRKALPEPDGADVSGLKYVAPRNAVEKKLAEIWQNVLGIEKLGIHDNFFNLGGDSFKGIRIVNKIQEWLKEVVHVTVLFLAPTIEELALKLQSYQKAVHSTVDAAKIVRMHRIIQPLPPLPADKQPKRKNPPALFLLCPPRSGSTLLRVILTGHPRLFAPQEFELLTFNTLQERNEGLSGKFSFYLEGVIRAIMEIKQCDADEAKKIMAEFEAQDMTSWEFYGVLQKWLGNKMLVEKTPAYTLDLETLKRAEDYFDSPFYIHLTRNPYATIYSYENAKLDQIFKYDCDFSPRELAEMVWLISHENILEFLRHIPDHRKYQVKYEELVRDPETVVSGICKFLKLEYHGEMIQVYKNPGKRMTDGIYNESKMLGDVKFFSHSSIDTSSVEKWKEKYKTEFLGEESVRLAKSLGYLQESSQYLKIEPVPRKEYYELSNAQKRLWILNQFEEEQISYNLSHVYKLEGEIDRATFDKSFLTLVKRHESLRTTFIRVKGEPQQKIHDHESFGFKLEYFDLRDENAEDRKKQAEKMATEVPETAFDLERGPLLKARLIQIAEKNYLFAFTTHHIISDGWSMNILIGEILKLYNAYTAGGKNPLPRLRLQYKDYSEWLNRREQEKIIKRQEEYWLKEFEGEIPQLNFPTDYPRPEDPTSEGNTLWFTLQKEQSRRLKDLALENGVTLFIVLLAIYTIMLSKLGSQEDIVVGSPIAGRGHVDLEPIVGMFVNMLALRNYPQGHETFKDFLHEVKNTTLLAFENQDYQFEDLVQRLGIKRDMRRNPLFDFTFTLLDIEPQLWGVTQLDIPGLNVQSLVSENTTAKFDIDLACTERDESVLFIFEYRTRLFKKETIERIFGYLKKIISSVINNIDINLMDIQLTKELAQLSSDSLTEETGDFGF